MGRDDATSRTEAQWREILPPDRYEVLRGKATERAFTGELLDKAEPGVYFCAGCGAELFGSDSKFDSGCGWPSFTAPIDGVAGDAIREETDNSLFMKRTEILCEACGGHLGHVFDDGPGETGLRYCVNSLSLEFAPDDDGVG